MRIASSPSKYTKTVDLTFHTSYLINFYYAREAAVLSSFTTYFLCVFTYEQLLKATNKNKTKERNINQYGMNSSTWQQLKYFPEASVSENTSSVQ